MKSTPELEAEIVRLHYAEHWPVGTIVTQLSAHVDQVRRVLGLDEPRAPSAPRPRVTAPYRPFIDEQLRRYPKLRATRLYDMVRARGFAGSVRPVREHVALVRPRPPREAYLVTETLPGEVAQVDWAHAGEIAVPGGVRALWLFVIVLANSRAMWGEFVVDLTVHSLCRSLVRAGRAFGGVARQWLFDNPKVVVLERIGTVARFHPTLLTLCAALRVEPKLCAVRKPRQKGKVERAIRYLRDRFLAGARSPTSTKAIVSSRSSSPRSHTSGPTRRSRNAPSARRSPRSVPGYWLSPSHSRRPRASSRSRPTRRRSSISTPIATPCPATTRRGSSRSSSMIARFDLSMVTRSLPSIRGLGGAGRSSSSPNIGRRFSTSAAQHATSKAATASAPWSPRSTASSSAGTSPARAWATASRAPSSCSTSTVTRCSPLRPPT